MARTERTPDGVDSSMSSSADKPESEIPPMAEAPPTDKDIWQESISATRRDAGPPEVEAETPAPLDDTPNPEPGSDPA